MLPTATATLAKSYLLIEIGIRIVIDKHREAVIVTPSARGTETKTETKTVIEKLETEKTRIDPDRHLTTKTELSVVPLVILTHWIHRSGTIGTKSPPRAANREERLARKKTEKEGSWRGELGKGVTWSEERGMTPMRHFGHSPNSANEVGCCL